MRRLTRTIPAAEWCVSDRLGPRVRRLLDVPSAAELLQSVITAAIQAASVGSIRIAWKESDERAGYFRLVAQLPLDEITFDQFFNGRSGYRAQYYISPEEGTLYNRDVVTELWPSLRTACERALLEVDLSLLERSLFAPHSKIWVFDERLAFDKAMPDTINPSRWVSNKATQGRKAPLLPQPMLDVKGAFIHPVTGDLFVDELKLDRAWDIFKRGYT